MNGTNATGAGEHGGMFNNEGGNDSGNNGKAGNRRLTNMEQQLLAEDGAAAGPAGYYGARGPGAGIPGVAGGLGIFFVILVVFFFWLFRDSFVACHFGSQF